MKKIALFVILALIISVIPMITAEETSTEETLFQPQLQHAPLGFLKHSGLIQGACSRGAYDSEGNTVGAVTAKGWFSYSPLEKTVTVVMDRSYARAIGQGTLIAFDSYTSGSGSEEARIVASATFSYPDSIVATQVQNNGMLLQTMINTVLSPLGLVGAVVGTSGATATVYCDYMGNIWCS